MVGVSNYGISNLNGIISSNLYQPNILFMYIILIKCIHKNFQDILTVLWKNIEIFPCEFTSHVDMHAVLYKDTELVLQEDKVWKMEKQKPYLQL